MRDDPMRQADIERRLSNLAKARRCGARTRAGPSVTMLVSSMSASMACAGFMVSNFEQL